MPRHRSERRSKCPAVILAGILMLVQTPAWYVLSAGPSTWLLENGLISDRTVLWVYGPLFELEKSTNRCTTLSLGIRFSLPQDSGLLERSTSSRGTLIGRDIIATPVTAQLVTEGFIDGCLSPTRAFVLMNKDRQLLFIPGKSLFSRPRLASAAN
jgi:hypothetical protein